MHIGTDIIEIARIEKAVNTNARFLLKYFTEQERALFDTRRGRSKVATIAANFAGKEAVAKALGTGLGQVRLQDIEILRQASGAPLVLLHGQARIIYHEQPGYDTEKTPETGISLSLSHSKDYAVAMVIIHG